MLAIRLQRRGKKHQAFYRLVVGEKRSKLLGKPTEDLGWYNPHSRESKFDKERVLHWLKNGAAASPTVHNLLVQAGVVQGKKLPKHKNLSQQKSSNALPG